MKKISIVFIFSLLVSNLFAQGYDITVKFKDLKNTQVILGYYFEAKRLVADTIVLDKNGEGVFKKGKQLTGGMYMLAYKTKILGDFILGEESKFSIESDTVNFNDHAKTNSKENQLFFALQKFRISHFEEMERLKKQLTTTSDKDKATINAQIEKQNKEMYDETKRIIAQNPTTFLAKFLKSTLEIDLPDRFKDKNGKFIDSLYYQYQSYYLSHYFDNFAISEVKMLRTPIYDSKIQNFLDLIEKQLPIDSLPKYIDPLIEESRKDKDVFHFVLTTIHNHYASSQIMCMDKMHVYIAEKYYIPEATWSDKKYIDSQKDQIRRQKPCLCYAVAKEMKMQSLPHTKAEIEDLKKKLKPIEEEGLVAKKKYDELKKSGKASSEDSVKLNNSYFYTFQKYEENMPEFISMHQIEQKYTILWFWEPPCSHCQKSTPMLGEMYRKLKGKDIEVFAVFIQPFVAKWDEFMKHTNEWYDFVLKNNLQDWINVWDIHHSTQFRDYYDISGTPVIYLLNEKKQIIAKRMGVELAEEIVIDLMFSDIYKKYKGEEQVKQVKAFVNEKFTLKEVDAMKKSSQHWFRGNEASKIEKFLNETETKCKKDFDKKISDIVSANADATQRTKKLNEFADSYYNRIDLNYIKESAAKILKDNEKTDFGKFVDERIQYKLEE